MPYATPFRRWAALAATLLTLTFSGFVGAQTNVAPAAGSIAAELDELGRYLAAHQGKDACKERCFVLDRLILRGSVGDGPLSFELSGGVLSGGATAVPLFGPPATVRVEVESKEAAAIGFEGDHYFFHTAEKRFVLKGKVWLGADLALAIPGPLNTLEAELEGGDVVEGARLSGIVGTTIHLQRRDTTEKVEGPTVFQLSRAVRVAKEISFEYRLVMRSGVDLGVVRLPLSNGEEVLDVRGATSFRVENGELVLPSAGKSAEMTITGKLPKVGNFAPDNRSSYEFWLFESDAEHRIFVTGDAKQVDSKDSPIPRTQASARLYLLQKGQKIAVEAKPLSSVDVLAAVVRQHSRTLVLTKQGDLVSDDTLGYENNGIDYLLYSPNARPIFLATDGNAERIMHQGEHTDEVLVPLLAGSHSVRTQSVSTLTIGSLGGALALPMPSYPLTASRVSLTVGAPKGVVPLALLGGDSLRLALEDGDFFALLVGFVAGYIAVRPRKEQALRSQRLWRALGGAALAGAYLISPVIYGIALFALVLIGLGALIVRLFRGPTLIAVGVIGGGLGGLVALILLASVGSMRSPEGRHYDLPAASPASAPVSASGGRSDVSKLGNIVAQEAEGGVIQGVTPVALSLPSYEKSLFSSRELVTQDRPFAASLVYVTELALAPLYVLWGIAVLLLGWTHRHTPKAAMEHVRERMKKAPPEAAADPVTPPVAAEKAAPKAE